MREDEYIRARGATERKLRGLTQQQLAARPSGGVIRSRRWEPRASDGYVGSLDDELRRAGPATCRYGASCTCAERSRWPVLGCRQPPGRMRRKRRTGSEPTKTTIAAH